MLNILRKFFSFLESQAKLHSVVLRDERTDGDTRYLGAKYCANGDLLIEGQDIGDRVEAVFGYIEYEWMWTIKSTNLPKLAKALGVKSNLLGALKLRFSGNAAADLWDFLAENEIPYESWSRIGD
ncbi:MAG TPA: hypothetical protein VM532_11845 [Burkholderiales bacterium]|jgi:hypothetical protein|nr:hypothetical protein [Burkholderiales bacterium]